MATSIDEGNALVTITQCEVDLSPDITNNSQQTNRAVSEVSVYSLKSETVTVFENEMTMKLETGQLRGDAT